LFFQNFANIQSLASSPSNQAKNNKFLTFFPFSGNFQSLQIFENVSAEENFNNFQKIDRWECNQYATFQSQETDFFLDIYPPKSLKHVHFLKYYEPSHYTLGSLICQIYAGVFPKQISKNILVIGESGSAKTFFLRALAGETEMKIITENASRYAMVQRGVAVGMKYLRDVFDAIALQTPCFFVMEDLHVIGSKRPFMISETESSQNLQASFGLEQQEVHETNQMIYQASRHSVSDFRRPYKGDFSIGIPTNFFLQTFYSPFFSSKNSFGQSHISNGGTDSFFYPIREGHQFQNSQFFGGNFSSYNQTVLSSPLPLDALEASLQKTGVQEKEMNNFESFSMKKNRKKIESCLQFSKEQIFAPPSTSPFTVLMMKEQKKLKPKKIIQETSWGGLSSDQILLYQKESSSIRAKIALLAEKTMNLSRGKFDMITDFLVILDSVRSNRGFVVFGTTHKPSSLDPALRRPGRFDETLSLSRNPNFLNRFEIFKMNLENSVSTFDFFDSSILTENFSEMDLFDILSQTKLSFLHNYKYTFQKSLVGIHHDMKSESDFSLPQVKMNQNFTGKKQIYSQISPKKAFHALLKSPIFEDFYTQKQFTIFASKGNILENEHDFSLRNYSLLSFFHQTSITETIKKSPRYSLLPTGPSHMLSLAYSKLGIFLSESNLLHNPTAFIPLSLDIEKNSSKRSNFQQFYGNLLYDSRKQRNLQLMVFLSGKIAEFFSQKNLYPLPDPSWRCEGKGLHRSYLEPESEEKQAVQFSTTFFTNFSFEKPEDFFSTKFGVFETSLNNFQKTKKQKLKKPIFSTKMNLLSKDKNPSFNSLLGTFQSSDFPVWECVDQKNFYWTVYGNEESWRSGTPFLFSLIQNRFLFTKNLLLSKMLFFENMDQRRKPPSPPGSSILMPSKKYENFKRTEIDFFQKAQFSIQEKIQLHQKQRFLKELYNIPVQKYFRSELRKNHKTLFSSSFQEFAYLDSFVQKSSSSQSYYRKYIQVRHRFSHINQWWNGMFPEHTREATYLSDVDWRTMFVSSAGTLGKQGAETKDQKLPLGKNKSANETFEFLMDFPDAEQYYNPRNRRWFFKSTFSHIDNTSHSAMILLPNGETKKLNENLLPNSTFWEIFEKDLQYEIFSHFLMESFYQSFAYFEKKREMLDFFVFYLLHKGFLKEFDFLTTFSRFKKLKTFKTL
jgi:SpoVK/Ycf46/Vps4 family AAA+-type ATPase